MVFRQCAGCKINDDRNNLIRITFAKIKGQIVINKADRFIFGRSLYLCKDIKCRRLFANPKKMKHYFASRQKIAVGEINLDDNIIEEIIK